MKKITVIGPTHPYKGGISHFTTILVKTLRKDNEVQFLSWKRQYPSFLYPIEQKDTKSKNPIKENAEFVLDFFNPLTWFKAFQDIKKNKSDLLILTWITPIQSPIYFIVTILTKNFTKTKVMYICHNVLPHEKSFYDKPLTKLTLSLADAFIVHSKQDKEILESLVGKKQIIVGFLPLFDMYENNKKYDIQKIKKELGLSKKVLLFFGYIRPYKGLKYLIEAMPKILEKHPDTSLLVVGEFFSKDKQSYLDLIEKLNLKDRVILINDYVPNEEVGKYFEIADVSVLPYVSATQSAVVQTSYSFNKPVIATNVGGLDDVILPGQTGYKIKPQNSTDISEKVNYFFLNKITSSQVQKSKQRWCWENYLNLINK